MGFINTAVGRATPEDALMRYKKALKNLIEDGDIKLTLFNDKNGKLVEKLEILVLTASENTELFNKATSLRDKLVGESVLYRGRFRKLMIEHEALLTGVWKTGTASTSVVPALLPRVRKEYDFLKPNMVHSDCTKRALLKFVTDGRTWTSKTISEIERKEEGIVYTALRTVIDAGWTEFLDRHPNIQNLS